MLLPRLSPAWHFGSAGQNHDKEKNLQSVRSEPEERRGPLDRDEGASQESLCDQTVGAVGNQNIEDMLHHSRRWLQMTVVNVHLETVSERKMRYISAGLLDVLDKLCCRKDEGVAGV